jgi:peptidoglycan/xylan/chitin deacetylase (PgdA/CDA1 family)
MHRVGTIAAAAAALSLSAALLAAAPARAESCPGNPDAIGTSRTIVVSPEQYQRLGSAQYKETLPLADHEVVITFDDGPLPPWTNKALDILASQCVKVTFFLVGEMAHSFPDVVRREYEAGHTIGTHSQSHPLAFERLTGDRLNYQIDQGIASVSAALGDPDDLAPFFRIPGLGRSPADESALADRGLVVFSIDVDADDWFRHITAAQVAQRAVSRLEKRGGGILLLHDIHPWTVEALPEILKELKAKGFHIVHIVPPAHLGPELAGGPRVWARAAAMPQARLIDRGSVSPAWPQANLPPESAATVLVAPDETAFAVGEPIALDDAPDGTARSPQWPQLSEVALADTADDFPAPGLSDIGVSLRGQELIGTVVPLRPALDLPGDHERFRHVHLHGHRLVRRPGGQRADALPGLSGLRSITALLTPAAPPVH